MEEVIAPVLDHLDRENPGEVVGAYLYGSAVAGGLRPDSDIDVLLLTRRSLTTLERAALCSLLLGLSGWRGHADRFPDAAHRRPVELTSIVVDDVDPCGKRAGRDFQYGEWLRGDLADGQLPQPTDDPDVVSLLATAQTAHRVLRGPELGDLVAPVSPSSLRQAMLAVIPDILAAVEGDERNTLLALARILVTLETGMIVSKDAAAEAVALTLAGTDRVLLERARDGYLGTTVDDWTGLAAQVTTLAHDLAERARQHRRCRRTFVGR